MYDDYDLDYASLSNEHYAYDLDEMCENHMNNALRDMHNIQDTYENDDDYARDTQDYVELRISITHDTICKHHTQGHMYAQKRIVSVTLDIECYEDLDLKSINWSDVLGLEGDENIDISIRETADVY